MDISVIIPHYGNPEGTLGLIQSVKNQLKSSKSEIIVSDDNSPIPFPVVQDIKIVRRSANGGFAANVNTGVAIARGEWLLILNSDLDIPPTFLVDMLAAAEEEAFRAGRGVMLSPQITGRNGESQWVGRAFPKTRHHAWEWFTPVARLRSTRFWHAMVGHDLASTTGNRSEPDWLMGACMMLRREDFIAVGGMDERFFMNSEEIDLQRRLSARGIKRIFRGDIVVEHAGGGSSGATVQRRQWVVDSRFLYNDKWGEGRYLAATLRTISILNYIFNLIRSIRNKNVDARRILQTELEFLKVR